MKNKKEFKKTLIDANLSLLVLLIGFFIILLSPLKLQAQEAVNFDNNINMQGTHRVINLAEPEVSSDAATLNYVDTEITNQIPDGQAVGQTFYWTGSEWLPSSNLYHDGTSVGIGTTDPNAKLEVDGLTKINGVLYREGYYDGILNQHAGVIESPGSGWVKLVTNIPFADNVMSNQIRIDVWKPGESHSLIIGSAISKGAFVEPTYTYLGNGVPPQVVLAEENSFVIINIKNINHIWEGGPTATVRVI